MSRTLSATACMMLLACLQVSAAEPPAATIDADSQALKRQALELDRDLRVMQERALYPADTQIAVFVAMDQGIFFGLESVKLEIDGQEVASQRYSETEAAALTKGGTQKFYIGNLRPGPHQLVAVFGGNGARYPVRRAVKLALDKEAGTQLVELRIADGEGRQEPTFTARVVK